MILPSENSRATKCQNTNGGVRVEGGLCGLAVSHLGFYFHSFIFHSKKAKEVNEGDGVAKTVLPNDPCTPVSFTVELVSCDYGL